MSVVTLFQTTFYRHCHFSKRLLYQFRHFFKRLFADTSTFSSDFRLRNYCKNLIEWTKQENFNFFLFSSIALHFNPNRASDEATEYALPTCKTSISDKRNTVAETIKQKAFKGRARRLSSCKTAFCQFFHHVLPIIKPFYNAGLLTLHLH